MIWILIVFVALLIGMVLLYNRLVRQRNIVAEAWAGIDVQLTRRFDLIPNLVELVKSYKEYEADTLEKVTRLRAGAETASAANVARRSADETQISTQIKKLIAVAEAYPELKADKNFRQLNDALVEVIATYQPTEMAVEDLFNAKNARSALILGHARGVILLTGARAGLEVAEYAPRSVKMAVTGNGGSTKQQVRFMIMRILGLKESPPLDMSDALAVALAHKGRRTLLKSVPENTLRMKS